MTRVYTTTIALACGVALVTVTAPSQAASYQVLYSFQGGSDGELPGANLINVNGTLYGTTSTGNGNGYGTVFALNPTTGAEWVVHSFQGSDGGCPTDGLIIVGGSLYGTTYQGGAYGYGAVFVLNPTTSTEKVIHSFNRPDGSDGAYPGASLTNVGGTLYGTTPSGGAYYNGTVFSLNPATGAEQVLHSFGYGTDGASPSGSLINVNGTLYGTTTGGGASNNGTVFALDMQTGAEEVVYSFKGQGSSDGAIPDASLINVNSTLYGTTAFGGAYNYGTVFSLNPATSAEQVVHSFGSGSDGAGPEARLIKVHGKLYGTTSRGGTSRQGTVFWLNQATGAEKVLHSFTGNSGDGDGEVPQAGLINFNGTLYGTTVGGGSHNCGYCGTVFALTP